MSIQVFWNIKIHQITTFILHNKCNFVNGGIMTGTLQSIGWKGGKIKHRMGYWDKKSEFSGGVANFMQLLNGRSPGFNVIFIPFYH